MACTRFFLRESLVAIAWLVLVFPLRAQAEQRSTSPNAQDRGTDAGPSGRMSAAEPLGEAADSGSSDELTIALRISERYLQSLLDTPVRIRSPVQTVVFGTRFRGTAYTQATLSADAIRCAEAAVFDLRIHGSCVSRSVGRNGPAIIHSTATTWFTAIKPVSVDDQRGFQAGRTRIATRTSSRVTSIKSTLPGLRGLIVRRVAARKSQQRQAEANEIARRIAQRSIAAAFDRRVDELVSQFNENLSATQLLVRQYGRMSKHQLDFCSSDTELLVALRRDGARGIAHLPAHEVSIQPVQLWVHESLRDGPGVRAIQVATTAFLRFAALDDSAEVPLEIVSYAGDILSDAAARSEGSVEQWARRNGIADLWQR